MRFERMYPWAVLPEQRKVNLEAARERERLYRDSFRHLRAARQPEFCAPWVLGQKIGWRVFSPVDVTLTELPQFEIATDDAQASAAAVGKQELWLRNGVGLAMDRPAWLHHYQFQDGDKWDSMFVPNGQGSVEWRQGWVAAEFEPFCVMVFPSEELPELGVLTGVLTPAVLERLKATGFSLACRPHSPVQIRRGQEIARIMLVSPESMRAS